MTRRPRFGSVCWVARRCTRGIMSSSTSISDGVDRTRMSRSSSDVTRICSSAVRRRPDGRGACAGTDYHGKLTIGTYEAAGEPSVDSCQILAPGLDRVGGYYRCVTGLAGASESSTICIDAGCSRPLAAGCVARLPRRLRLLGDRWTHLSCPGASRTNSSRTSTSPSTRTSRGSSARGTHRPRGLHRLFSIWDNRLHTASRTRTRPAASFRCDATADRRRLVQVGHGDDGTSCAEGGEIEYDLGAGSGRFRRSARQFTRHDVAIGGEPGAQL